MGQQTYTKAEKFAEWEALGEDAVRTKFELGHFGAGGDKRALAKMWLDQKERDRIEASNSANFRVARSAKNAAWLAAIMATIAAIVAIVSAVIAYLALASQT
jgi:hypothetical protein